MASVTSKAVVAVASLLVVASCADLLGFAALNERSEAGPPDGESPDPPDADASGDGDAPDAPDTDAVVADLYVSPTGDDDANGSRTAPLRGLQEALRRARERATPTTIAVCEGDYPAPDALVASGPVRMIGGFRCDSWTRRLEPRANGNPIDRQSKILGVINMDPTVAGRPELDGFYVESPARAVVLISSGEVRNCTLTSTRDVRAEGADVELATVLAGSPFTEAGVPGDSAITVERCSLVWDGQHHTPASDTSILSGANFLQVESVVFQRNSIELNNHASQVVGLQAFSVRQITSARNSISFMSCSSATVGAYINASAGSSVADEISWVVAASRSDGEGSPLRGMFVHHLTDDDPVGAGFSIERARIRGPSLIDRTRPEFQDHTPYFAGIVGDAWLSSVSNSAIALDDFGVAPGVVLRHFRGISIVSDSDNAVLSAEDRRTRIENNSVFFGAGFVPELPDQPSGIFIAQGASADHFDIRGNVLLSLNAAFRPIRVGCSNCTSDVDHNRFLGPEQPALVGEGNLTLCEDLGTCQPVVTPMLARPISLRPNPSRCGDLEIPLESADGGAPLATDIDENPRGGETRSTTTAGAFIGPCGR